MDHDGLNADAWQLHDWYRNGIFEINVSEIAQTARKKLKATLKTEKKVDEFLQEVAEILNPLNQPIPAVGKGIAKIFDARPAPGYAFALQRFVNENEDDKAWELIKKHSGKLLQIAVLALSKPGDNQIAILHTLHTKDKIEFRKRSKVGKSSAESQRPERSPFHAYLKQRLNRVLRDSTNKEVLEYILHDQGGEFKFRKKVATMNVTQDMGSGSINWAACYKDGGKEIPHNLREEFSFDAFEKLLSKIRGELGALIKPHRSKKDK